MSKDEKTPKARGHLRVASSRSDRDVAISKRMHELAMAEFAFGSFENVLANREYLVSRHLHAFGVNDQDGVPERIKDMIPAILHEKGRTIDVVQLPIPELTRLSKMIEVNLGVRGWLNESGIEFADNPDLPEQNVRKYATEFRDIIWKLVGTLSHREELERALAEKGIDISHQDATRLLLYELNKDNLRPKVLVLPNDHKPYNPFLVHLSGEGKLPASVVRLLRCFDR